MQFYLFTCINVFVDRLKSSIHEILYNIIQYYIILYNIIQYYIILYNIIQYYTILYNIIQYYTILYYTIQYYTIPRVKIQYKVTELVSKSILLITQFLDFVASFDKLRRILYLSQALGQVQVRFYNIQVIQYYTIQYYIIPRVKIQYKATELFSKSIFLITQFLDFVASFDKFRRILQLSQALGQVQVRFTSHSTILRFCRKFRQTSQNFSALSSFRLGLLLITQFLDFVANFDKSRRILYLSQATKLTCSCRCSQDKNSQIQCLQISHDRATIRYIIRENIRYMFDRFEGTNLWREIGYRTMDGKTETKSRPVVPR